jgi:acetyl esterase
MASEGLHKLTRYMRGLQGTRAGKVRDATLRVAGVGFSGYYALSKRLSKERRPHPLFRILAAQAGDPYDEWPLDDVGALRAKSEALLDFLPCQVHGDVVEHSVGGNSGVRILEVAPRTLRSDVCVAYFHGGGFVMGSAESVLPEADALGAELGCVVYVVDYPLAPESKLDQQVAAANEALSWIRNQGKRFRVVGESAGGYLSLFALLDDDSLNADCDAVVLFYPFLDLQVNSESVQRFSSGFMLSRRILQWFVACASPRDGLDAWNLGQGESQVQAPVLIIVGEYDPLLDDWRAVSKRVPNLTLEEAPGLMHGFMQMRGILPDRERWLRRAIEFLG